MGVIRGMPALGRLLPGLFPSSPVDFETGVRRILLALLLLLALTGVVCYAAFSRDPALALPLGLAVVGALAACAVPWQRQPRDAFAVVGISTTALTSWMVALTGGGRSPLEALAIVGVTVLAIPLSRPVGTTLALCAALAAALPLSYQESTTLRASQEMLVRSLALTVAAVFAPWLMEVVRHAVRTSSADRERLASEQEIASDLRRAHSVRQEYLSVLAHELRNPLTAINAAARVLAKEIEGGTGAGTARGIATEAHHALELLDGLTDVASLESGRMRMALRPMDLCAVLAETATAMFDGHPITLRGAERPLQVLGDDRRIGQVIRNLISNAAKYSPPEAEIHVSLGVSADRRTAIVQVRDRGAGIPPSERPRLFEKFARLSTAGGTRGSGLGLFISRGIVKDHGGEMWADWPAGGGSVFSFSIPLMGEGRAP